MRRVFVLLAAIALVAVPACGDNDDSAAEPTATATVTITAEPTTPTPTVSPSQAPVAGPQWGTDDVTVPFAGTVPPVPTLVAIRVGTHPEGRYDRIAMEFEGLPGYEVRYQSEIVYDGSGEPVELDGRAFIQIVFSPAQAHDDEGRSTLGSPPIEPVTTGHDALSAYVLNGDFEGYVSIALGLTDKVGFNVEQFLAANGSYIIYVDVATP